MTSDVQRKGEVGIILVLTSQQKNANKQFQTRLQLFCSDLAIRAFLLNTEVWFKGATGVQDFTGASDCPYVRPWETGRTQINGF